MKSRNPVANWLISTCTTRNERQPYPSDALSPFLDGGRDLIADQSYDVMQMVKRFSILNIRFGYAILRTADFDWHKLLSTQFSLLDGIESKNPENLADSITASVTALFRGVSMANVLTYGPSVKAITANWSDMSDDVAACLIADPNLAPYMMELAEVRCRL